MSTYDRLIAIIRSFVEAESWDESREIVERHPELLTTDVVDALETFARNAEKVGNADMAHTFRIHRQLLRRCAEIGTVAAFLELSAPPAGPPPGPGLEIPREVLTEELLALSREIWTSAPDVTSSRWWTRRIELLEHGIALTAGNPDAAPMWATFHVELAHTLMHTPNGDRAANIERAIASFESAARIWTPDVAPQQWATIQENLGKAYDLRAEGNKAAADEAADDELITLAQEFGDPLAPGGPYRRIEVCERMIELLTPPDPDSAELWVGTHVTLAENLQKLPDGDHAENLEQALAVLETALAMADRDRHPEGWAAAYAVLGVVRYERIRGNRAENLDGAIRALELSMQVRTREADPLIWAATANNLAMAYLQQAYGDRAGNMEKAIGLLDAAMAIRTREQMSEQWAASTSNLGNVYSMRVRGDRADNLEEAIGCYQDALTVWRRDRAPDKWAQVMNALGAAYAQRVRGEPASNIETAIENLTAALTVRRREHGPAAWAETTRNLANAYCLRMQGDRQQNIEAAIARYRDALTAVRRETNPIEWASTQIGLGNAYAERATERVDSLNRAIAAYEAAASVVDRTSTPVEWVATRIGLGNAHLERVQGGRTENIEQARRHFDAALEVATRARMPREWAILQHGLAGAYAVRRVGDRATNLQLALTASEAAFEVRTRAADPLGWAMTLQNLVPVLMDPELPGDRSAHQERAMEAVQSALEVASREATPHRWAELRGNLGGIHAQRLAGDRVANLRAAVAAFTDVLEVHTKAAVPVAWAQIQRNLGTAYGELALLDGEPAADLVGRAFAAFAAALPVLREHSPVQETRDAARGWGDLAFRLERWREAADAFEISMDAADTLYSASVLAAGRRSELDESVIVCQRAALARAYTADENDVSDDLVRAVVAVEHSRARWLGETLERDQANLAEAKAVNADAVERYGEAVAKLRALEGEERRPARVITHKAAVDDTAVTWATEEMLTEQLRTAHAELAAALDGIRAIGGQFTTYLERTGFDTVIDALAPGQAMAYLLVTTRGSLALLVHRHPVGPPTVSSVRAELTNRDLASMLLAEDDSSGYLPGQANAPHTLGAVLATVLPGLGERLVAPIARRLRELGADAVALVPCGLLGTLPLHAAPYSHHGATRRLIDEFDVTFSPSARVTATACARLATLSTAPTTLAGVGNPQTSQPLRFARRELLAVAALFDDPHPLYDADATAQALTEAARRAQYVHLACHGSFDVVDPLKSGLELAGGRLTVRDILGERPFTKARLVVASACKSAVFDINDLPDEVVGLPAGILCGGTPGVIGTLWSVNDRSTAILMSRFYAFHLKGDPTTGEPPMPPARALRKAQLWLSTATDADPAVALPRDLTPDDAAPPGPERSDERFSDPYYWAPFVLLGT